MNSQSIPAASQPTSTLTLRRGVLFWSALWVVCLLVVFSRRPEAILSPQFWSEDGRIWYADAYNIGALKALFLPYAGYVNIIPRLTAALSLLVPLSQAPLLFNAIAILFQVTPVLFLNSKRFDTIIPSLWLRLFMSFLYLAIPNVWEVDANITNAQWHAALILFLIIIASPRRSRSWSVFDVAIIFLSGLTGPFILVMFPLSSIYWWFKRTPYTRTNALLMSVPFLVQMIFVLFVGNSSRYQGHLGATLPNFITVVAGQVITSSAIGIKGYLYVWHHLVILTVLFIIGVTLLVVALLRAPLELKIFLVFCGGILLSALLSPAQSTHSPAWKAMGTPNTNLRYFFFPTLGWFATLVWSAKARSLWLKSTALLFLTVMVMIGIPVSWRDPSLVNMHFQEYVVKFNQAPAGSAVAIPLNPVEWKTPMILQKK